MCVCTHAYYTYTYMCIHTYVYVLSMILGTELAVSISFYYPRISSTPAKQTPFWVPRYALCFSSVQSGVTLLSVEVCWSPPSPRPLSLMLCLSGGHLPHTLTYSMVGCVLFSLVASQSWDCIWLIFLEFSHTELSHTKLVSVGICKIDQDLEGSLESKESL